MSDKSFNPYVGLRPFTEEENLLFFGRDEQTLELLQRLHSNRFVAVVGSSGSGKSSLIRAGLIPALKGGFLVENSSQWLVAVMKPGQNPMYNLAETILRQINYNIEAPEIQALVKRIKKEGVSALLNTIQPLRINKNANFFLLVDQFEELFRFSMKQTDASHKTEAIDFVNIILKLSEQKHIPFYVVLTMRSDFIGDCAQFFGLPEALNKSQYLVPRLNRLELKKVIEGPAKLYGGKFNTALTSRLINDLGKVKDELPLVQHALMRMWDYEVRVDKSGELDLEDYKQIGGIENALSVHADEALKELKPEEVSLAKSLFQALTTIDENGRKIRRPAQLSYLKKLTGASEDKLKTVINNFIKENRSFLVVGNIGDTGDKLIDISHESLIRHWKILNHWVEEENNAAVQYLGLCDAQLAYSENRKDLLSGKEFEITQEWFKTFEPSKIWAERFNTNFDEKYKDRFDESINYLSNSAKVYNKKKLNARRVKRFKKGILYTVITLLSLGTFYYFTRPITDQKAWDLAVSENTVGSYETYIDSYGKGEYATVAHDSIASLKFKKDLRAFWLEATTLNAVKGYENYLNFAATTRDADGKITGFSKLAKYVSIAQKKIDSLRNSESTTLLDDNAWKIAQSKNRVSSYLNYIKNEKVIGEYDMIAMVKLQEVGKTGFLYAGKANNEQIYEPVFDLIYRNGGEFKDDSMLRVNDIVRTLQNRRIYNDPAVRNESGNLVRQDSIYFVKSVFLQGNAVFVEIIY
ncbi:nSTAND1 domain-containing NTPase [Aequorivita flava]|uniref:Novel STAND NTPase 1 domain-containing protein n=1 Tax=Aequorivita flava TaxID=3114371 RepID=A0AB35YMV6_9FLAO